MHCSPSEALKVLCIDLSKCPDLLKYSLQQTAILLARSLHAGLIFGGWLHSFDKKTCGSHYMVTLDTESLLKAQFGFCVRLSLCISITGLAHIKTERRTWLKTSKSPPVYLTLKLWNISNMLCSTLQKDLIGANEKQRSAFKCNNVSICHAVIPFKNKKQKQKAQESLHI